MDMLQKNNSQEQRVWKILGANNSCNGEAQHGFHLRHCCHVRLASLGKILSLMGRYEDIIYLPELLNPTRQAVNFNFLRNTYNVRPPSYKLVYKPQ